MADGSLSVSQPGSRPGFCRPWIAAVASGALLAAAFPPLEWAFLAWGAWVPLVWAVSSGNRRDAIRNGFLAGGVFWGFSLFWLTCVTAAGWAILALYCSLYTVPLSVFVHGWITRRGLRSRGGNLGLAVGAATVWAGFEYLRSVWLTGFPWNALGVSQYRFLPLIQVAEWGGVFAVSWGIVACNVLLAAGIFRARVEGRRAPGIEAGVALGLVAGIAAWGMVRIRTVAAPDSKVRMALIQPAVPQHEKWTPAFVAGIHARLARLSVEAIRTGSPDLVVWPETAVSESPRHPGVVRDLLRSIADRGVPLLVGAVDGDLDPRGEELYYNSSLMIGPEAEILHSYDKQHLVVYGEYVPFGEWLPFLRSLTPFDYDITPGREPGIFRLESRDLLFTTLICFEDVIPGLSREAVRRGVRVLVNQTNDAWFDGSSGSRQHMAQAVFRCVENRVPMVRCGNSGVSAWIDAVGRIGGGNSVPLPIVNAVGQPASGYTVVEVGWVRAGRRTFYTRAGDAFGIGCAAIALGLAFRSALRRIRARKRSGPIAEAGRFAYSGLRKGGAS